MIKTQFRKILGTMLACAMAGLLAVSCQAGTGGGETSGSGETYESVPLGNRADYPASTNPEVDANPAKSLDFIFNNTTMGFTTIEIRRSEWNKMLKYFDYFYKNENLVIGESYTYEKDGQTWKMNGIGLRLRGNTSRFRPQGKDHGTDECGNKKMNEDWSANYYSYAATCSDNDYRQSHFKVDFEPFDNDDCKMSKAMKGVALKRMDAAFTREIMCYDQFHQRGLISVPRASHTKVIINFIEDVAEDGTVKTDISNCAKTKVDFGVYEMFEEVNKQSLKARSEKNNDGKKTWKNNNGDLWKCCGGDLLPTTDDNFGVEDIEIKNTHKAKSAWKSVWKGYNYDLKTNKSELNRARSYIKGFIKELDDLKKYNANTSEGIEKRKAFYEKWFDVDLFIKTYAVNILCGNDDDYWGNANNYYLYFDNGDKGTNKCYFIPFDFDNTLGQSIDGDGVLKNPLTWGTKTSGEKCNRPLMDRLLEVPEYLAMFKAALLEVSSQESDSPWNKTKCMAQVNAWKTLVTPYIYTTDIKDHGVGEIYWGDYGGWKDQKHYLTREPNIYEDTTNSFVGYVKERPATITFDLNGGNINGKTDAVVINNASEIKDLSVLLASNPKKSGYIFAGWTETKDGTDYVTKNLSEKVYAKWVDKVQLWDTAVNGNIMKFEKLEPYKDYTIELVVSYSKERALADKEADGHWAGIGFAWEERFLSWWKNKGDESFIETYKCKYSELMEMYANTAHENKARELKFNCFDIDKPYSAKVNIINE